MSTGRPPLARALLQPPFIAAAVALLAAAVFAGPVARYMKVVLRKEPVPLRKPLPQLDKLSLGEYAFDSPRIIDAAVLGPLGTEEYIDWRFIDTTVDSPRDPLRFVRCFITYYTGKPDLVPHTPEVCYLGQGYRKTEAEDLNLRIVGPDAATLEVPVRAVTFIKSEVFGRATPTVVYTFHCNGSFLRSRTEVRARLANPFERGAYYSKIEVTFGSPQSQPLAPNRQDAIAGAEKFLNKLLPVLLREHLPDWEALQSDGQA
jgi:hypothetical protein